MATVPFDFFSGIVYSHSFFPIQGFLKFSLKIYKHELNQPSESHLQQKNHLEI